jgi:hypothetical protein
MLEGRSPRTAYIECGSHGSKRLVGVRLARRIAQYSPKRGGGFGEWAKLGSKKNPTGLLKPSATPVAGSVSDPDPNPVGSAFNLSLDPGSGSIFGIQIWILDPDV